MKRLFLFLFIFVSISASYTQPKPFKRIGLINPTISNIEKILFLVNHNLIQADSFSVVGVVHKSQEEWFKDAYQFVAEHKYNNVSFEIINNDVPIDSLFCVNQCTPDFQKVFKNTDAMLFFGGEDIPPKIYGEKTFITTEMIPKEQNWELSFLFHLTGGSQNITYVPFLEQRPDYIVMGICLGMQEMNVAGGGSLYQDIPNQVYGKKTFEDITAMPMDKQHRYYWNRTDNTLDESHGLHFHHIKINKDSYLHFNSTADNPLVVSAHHQAVKKLARYYKVIATSTDKKIVEAIINTKYKNVYGIQFHTDATVIYKEGKTFETIPGQTFNLDKESRLFNAGFWKDFSSRLYKQK